MLINSKAPNSRAQLPGENRSAASPDTPHLPLAETMSLRAAVDHFRFQCSKKQLAWSIADIVCPKGAKSHGECTGQNYIPLWTHKRGNCRGNSSCRTTLKWRSLHRGCSNHTSVKTCRDNRTDSKTQGLNGCCGKACAMAHLLVVVVPDDDSLCAMDGSGFEVRTGPFNLSL